MPKVFTVIIYPCIDTIGYWAECAMPNGGCFTDGETIQEIKDNMFESIRLFLKDDYPDIQEYSLKIELSNA